MTDVASQPSVQQFKVPDVSCNHCVDAITSEVAPLAGVAAVDVDLETKIVTVTGGDHAAIIAAIDEAGYDVAAD
ncbi:MAG: heavy-metal-associated domain-containing protein [Acidimicrobiia bacterium]|nr:heavy-metal-associated domain-containing protein [Acidimicrobiia bacterium]